MKLLSFYLTKVLGAICDQNHPEEVHIGKNGENKWKLSALLVKSLLIIVYFQWDTTALLINILQNTSNVINSAVRQLPLTHGTFVKDALTLTALTVFSHPLPAHCVINSFKPKSEILQRQQRML